jgi:hypothetical protein
MIDTDTNPGAHDPALPILRELEEELRTQLRCLDAAPAGPTRGTRGVVRPVLVTRRALLLVALVSLVGASALAARAVIGGGAAPKPSAKPTELASAGVGAEAWQLQAYEYGGATCYALFVEETATSACGAPGRRGVRVVSALSARARVVAGLAGTAVRRVRVRVGTRIVFTSTQAETKRAERVGLPKGLRWFVVTFPDSLRTAPARVTPLGANGHALGPVALDCSLGGANAACRGQAAHAAAPAPQA